MTIEVKKKMHDLFKFKKSRRLRRHYIKGSFYKFTLKLEFSDKLYAVKDSFHAIAKRCESNQKLEQKALGHRDSKICRMRYHPVIG